VSHSCRYWMVTWQILAVGSEAGAATRRVPSPAIRTVHAVLPRTATDVLHQRCLAGVRRLYRGLEGDDFAEFDQPVAVPKRKYPAQPGRNGLTS
jgi:hypothetical protein